MSGLTPGDRDPLEFVSGVAEKLGFYVYALRDPRDQEIFYVGKGKGDRVYAHARQAKRVDDLLPAELKLARIRDIQNADLDVDVEIIRHGMDQDTAYDVEAGVIDGLRLAGSTLLNRVVGHGDGVGWVPLRDLVANYVAEPVEISPEHKVMLIRVSRKYKLGMSAENLYELTRRWWKVAPDRHQADWAFAVFGGIVRAVYRIQSWEEPPENLRVGNMVGRLGFAGDRDPAMEEHYLWRSVVAYMALGAQNPIRYVHC